MTELELFQMYHLKEMPLSAELFLSCSILQLTFYVISTAYQRKHGFVILNRQIYHLGALIVGLAALLLINEDLLINNSLSSNNFIVNDYLSFATKLIISLTSLLFLVIVKISYKDELIQNNFEYVVLVLISVLGLLLLCSSNDLITAYLSIELQSVAFYLMAAFKKNSSYSIESGLKYFIVGSLSSAFFLFGSSLIYGCVGSLNFDDFKAFLPLLALSNFVVATNSFETNDELTYTYLQSSDPLAAFELSETKVSLFNFLSAEQTFADWAANNGYAPSLLSWKENFSTNSMSALLGNNGLESSRSSSESYLQISEILACQDKAQNLAIFNSESGLAVPHELFKSFEFALLDGSTSVTSSVVNLDLVSIGFLLICISLLIKLAIAPFHYWSLDVYEGSPSSTTFFFAVVPKMGLFILLLRVCYVSFYDIFCNNYQFYFLTFAVISVFVGAIGGLKQRRLKSLLAYSSVSHTGYLLLSFGTSTTEGMQMMLYYLAILMVSGLCFWSVFLFVRQKQSFYFNKHNKELGDFVLLKESNPMLALILAITLFSIAGIPPIVGFLAKIGIFVVVIRSSAYLVSLISILFSVVSTFYYLRFIKVLYFENILVGKLYFPISTKKSLLVAILSLSLIVLCFNPMLIYLVFHKAMLLVV